MILNPRAQFDLAVRLRNESAPLGEVFSFLSGLYFRGKLTYANRFAVPHRRVPGVLVITSNRGLIPADTRLTADDLRSFSDVPINGSDARYAEPLMSSALKWTAGLPKSADVILLGSIGTKKYVEPLIEVFHSRLKFPIDFVGRGDMSRGGLLLRCVYSGRELPYVPVAGVSRHGTRPPRLEPYKHKD